MSNRDKVIAAAKEAGFSVIPVTGSIYLIDGYKEAICTLGVSKLYAIAFEDGRQADKADAERYRWLCEQNEKGVGYFHLVFATRNIMNWKTKTEIDDGIDRARGDTK